MSRISKTVRRASAAFISSIKSSKSQNDQKVTPQIADEITPLMIAAKEQNFNKVKDLIPIWDYNPKEINTHLITGLNALYYAAHNDDLDMLKYLVKRGGNVNLLGKSKRTPLMEAVSNRNKKMVDYLIEKGAEIFVEDDQSNNIILIACQKSQKENMLEKDDLDILKLLVNQMNKKRAKDERVIDSIINKNEHFRTPLMEAVEKGYYEVVKFLIDELMKRKINNTDLDNHINARDKNGQTALIHAENSNPLKNYLIEHGANQSGTNSHRNINYGFPSQFQGKNQNLETFKKPVNAGADSNSNSSLPDIQENRK